MEGNRFLLILFINVFFLVKMINKKCLFLILNHFILLDVFLTQPIIQTLSVLIQYQLNQLTLTFHEDIFKEVDDARESPLIISDIGNQ